MQKEQTNIAKIHKTLKRHGSEEIRERAARIYAGYRWILRDWHPELPPASGGTFEDLFRAWLNGEAFHFSKAPLAQYERYNRELGNHYEFIVQAVVLHIAGRILDMDDVVADFLGEPQVARIGAPDDATKSATSEDREEDELG
jgi:hypothetical protein